MRKLSALIVSLGLVLAASSSATSFMAKPLEAAQTVASYQAVDYDIVVGTTCVPDDSSDADTCDEGEHLENVTQTYTFCFNTGIIFNFSVC